MFCNKCGKDIGKANVKFCPFCGGRTDMSHGTKATSTTKAEATKTNNGKTSVNKTAIIVASIIAAAVVIASLIISSNGVNIPENGRDLIGLGNIGDTDSPKAAGIKIENVGDIVEFGTWRSQPIEWRVLEIDGKRALLISKDILTVRQYDGLTEYGGPSNIDNWEDVKVTWADSDIRAWLNDDFLNEAFSKSEQRSILLSEVSNPDNAKYGTDGGKDTKDKVFFLNISEANRFFKGDDDRIAKLKMTEEDLQYILKIAKSDWGYDQDLLNEVETNLREQNLNQRQAWWWWLRSPGNLSSSAASVNDDGYVYASGYDVHYISGVRPALYINL